MCNRSVALAVLAALTLCPALHAAQPTAANAPAKKIAAANNRFAFEFYRTLSADDSGKNIFVSPVSLSTALAMTFEGGRGQTRAEMASALHFDLSDQERRAGFAELMQQLQPGADKHYQLSIANALWGRQDFSFLPAFTQTIAKDYGGVLTPVVFPDPATSIINKWVEDKTSGKIKDILHSGDLDEHTRLVLTNAIYFKGDWEQPFADSATQPEDFHLASGQAVQASLMHRTGPIAYAHEGDAAAVELPYKGGDLSMLVLLPDTTGADGMKRFESALTDKTIAALRAHMAVARVDLALPRFTFQDRYQLGDALQALGIRQAFGPSADFSGMTGHKNILLSKVIQQTYIDVNERGSEAAAATVIGMRAMAARSTPPPILFRADRPFLYLIIHKPTGAILFLGRVANPAA
jgi:serpin B